MLRGEEVVMSSTSVEFNLAIRPKKRFEIIDVSKKLHDQFGSSWLRRKKAVYCSLHTTAGYLEQGTCRSLGEGPRQLDPFIRTIQKIFPPNAGYYHDRMQLRDELSPMQKKYEPINADSHLTFMSAGLNNCVTYTNRSDESVYFIELDGIFKDCVRERQTTVIAYDRTEVVHRDQIKIPITSNHAIDSFNLKDPSYGLFAELQLWIQRFGVDKGIVDIRLCKDDRHVGLTVNEYETLLMRNDLPQVLRDPLRYMMSHGKKFLLDPGAMAGKTRGYATYDLIHLYNDLMRHLPGGRSLVDKILSVLSSPAKRMLRLKRHVSFLVSDSMKIEGERILVGKYQSPILVQHHPASNGVRYLDVTLRRFV
tara:strand:- start:1771 stop:2865 length:1095 start_codon:yes stop_codon:yes gene_type:complete